MLIVYVSTQETANRAQIWKRLRSPGIDYKESIPPVFVACMAGRYDNPICRTFLGIDFCAP